MAKTDDGPAVRVDELLGAMRRDALDTSEQPRENRGADVESMQQRAAHTPRKVRVVYRSQSDVDIEVDGVALDVAALGVSRVELRLDAGTRPEIRITLVADALTIEGEMRVTMQRDDVDLVRELQSRCLPIEQLREIAGVDFPVATLAREYMMLAAATRWAILRFLKLADGQEILEASFENTELDTIALQRAIERDKLRELRDAVRLARDGADVSALRDMILGDDVPVGPSPQ